MEIPLLTSSERAMKTKIFEDAEKTAYVSGCGRYRHTLGRHWNRPLGYVLFIGLNPSTADAEKDDPTIRRCMRFANDWGYGGIEMCNLFDWRATDPKKLPRREIAVSDKNDPSIACRALEAAMIIAAWGAVPWAEWRIKTLFNRAFSEEKRWHALQLTKDGFPRHPLYVRASIEPVVFW